MGHVFRDKSPYSFPGGVAKIVNKNAARVAEVWMDEWRDFYYAMNPGGGGGTPGILPTTSKEEMERRKRTGCCNHFFYGWGEILIFFQREKIGSCVTTTVFFVKVLGFFYFLDYF